MNRLQVIGRQVKRGISESVDSRFTFRIDGMVVAGRWLCNDRRGR